MAESTYIVTSKRVIPIDAAAHAGKTAVCVKLHDGFIAWGYGDASHEAEKAALKKAMELRGVSNRII